MTKTPSIPNHLQAATKRWVRDVLAGWDLEPHHHRLLVLAAQAWDRAQQARAQLDRDGLTIETRHGETRVHPCVSIERDSAVRFARLLRELDLDVAAPSETRPPPLPRYTRGGEHG
jgi:phage terminase small subunit